MSTTQISLAVLRGKTLRSKLKRLTYSQGYMREVLNLKLPAYGKIALAERDNKLVGWAVISKACGAMGVNPIVMVYVNPRYRKKGIAKILVEEVLKGFKSLYKQRKIIKSYKIPAEKINLIYYDRVTELFFFPIKKNGFNAKLL